jgi:chitosanase
MINPISKKKIIETLNVVETSTREGNYAKISKFFDGPGKRQQITYGRSQLTEYGFLPKLISRYEASSGLFSKEFTKYKDKIGGTHPSLVKDIVFLNLLTKSANDPIMKRLQDEIFEVEYWMPALIFWKENGFVLPLSLLVIYDTAIHSGPALNNPKTLFHRLRNRFKEPIPKNGGDEKKWVESYVKVRHDWLINNSSEDLVRSSYRTKCYLELIKNGNWDLSQPFKMNGVTID